MFAVMVFALSFAQAQPGPVSFPAGDGATIHGTIYGAGTRGVVLAHGGRYDSSGWAPQARRLAEAGFFVLAFDFRGVGRSAAAGDGALTTQETGRHQDVLGAVRYLRSRGATTVGVVGASMGGDYAAEAAEADPDAIDRLVLIAAGAYTTVARMGGPKLFIMTRDDIIGDNTPRMPAIRARYDRASGPKRFVTLEGAAHAQAIFETPQGETLLRELIAFLSAGSPGPRPEGPRRLYFRSTIQMSASARCAP